MSLLSILRNVLEDRACFLCGEESRLPLCPSCISELRRCDEGWSESRLAAGSASGFSAYWYESTLRQAILQMKVQGEYQLAPLLASILVGTVGSLKIPLDTVFVPIPRFADTAQNCVHQFPYVACRALAEAFGGDADTHVLYKTRRTALQTQLTDAQRLVNVAGAFDTACGAANRLEGRTVVIVDDVLTTGATVHAAASAILKTSPHQCLYLTLARSRATIRAGL